MGVASGCGEQKVGVASGSGWNLWVWLLGVVLRRYIDFLILLIPTPLVSVLFCSSIPTFCSFFKMFFVLLLYILYLCITEFIVITVFIVIIVCITVFNIIFVCTLDPPLSRCLIYGHVCLQGSLKSVMCAINSNCL